MWWRFHGAPGAASLAAALRLRPVVFAVAGFLLTVWAALAAAGFPLVRLPPDPWSAWAVFGGFTLLVSVVLAGVVGAASTLRLPFFATGDRGRRQRRLVGAARAGLCWAAAETVVGILTGAGPGFWLAAGPVGLVFAWAARSLVLGRRMATPAAAARPGWPGPVAWWFSAPEVYGIPLVVWVLGAGAVAAGAAGLTWSDRLPVNALLLAFGWPALLALGSLGLNDRIPYRLFRAVRAPWHRVTAAVVGPLAVQTAGASAVALAASADLVQGLSLASVCLTGAALWVFLPLRFPTAGLALPAVGTLVFVGGASVLETAAPAWAFGQGVAALVLAVGWKTRYEEGDCDADR